MSQDYRELKISSQDAGTGWWRPSTRASRPTNREWLGGPSCGGGPSSVSNMLLVNPALSKCDYAVEMTLLDTVS